MRYNTAGEKEPGSDCRRAEKKSGQISQPVYSTPRAPEICGDMRLSFN